MKLEYCSISIADEKKMQERSFLRLPRLFFFTGIKNQSRVCLLLFIKIISRFCHF